MIKVKGLIWDEWNREHIVKHDVTVAEVEEACHAKIEISDSYRKRILVIGKQRRKGYLLSYNHLKTENFNDIRKIYITQ